MMSSHFLNQTQANKIDVAEGDTTDQLERKDQSKVEQLSEKFDLRIDRINEHILDETALSQIKEKPLENAETMRIHLKELAEPDVLIQIESQSSFIPLEEEEIQDIHGRQSYEKLKSGGEPRTQSIFIKSFEQDQLSGCIEDLNQEMKSVKIEEEDRIHQIFLKICRESSNRPTPQGKSGSQEVGISKQKQIFQNIQCDRCFAFPIKGPVFRCLVCSNFDLCSCCQDKYHQFHPFLEVASAEHWPLKIEVLFDEKAKRYMKNELKEEEITIKQEKERKYRKGKNQSQQINLSTLKSTEFKGPNFMARLLGGSFRE